MYGTAKLILVKEEKNNYIITVPGKSKTFLHRRAVWARFVAKHIWYCQLILIRKCFGAFYKKTEMFSTFRSFTENRKIHRLQISIHSFLSAYNQATEGYGLSQLLSKKLFIPAGFFFLANDESWRIMGMRKD